MRRETDVTLGVLSRAKTVACSVYMWSNSVVLWRVALILRFARLAKVRIVGSARMQ